MCVCDKPSARRTISLGFSNEPVLEGQHICYLYNDDTERRRVMAKYLESGILAKEKLLYLVDSMTPGEMVDCLEELGVDARSKAAELTIADAASGYCPHGTFNADEILDMIRGFYLNALTEGYTGARGTGEMSWCLVHGRADETALMAYEARLNLLIADFPYTACCQYDTRRFDGQVILDVLAVHPVMIVRGQLVKNPYFIEPAAYLQQLRARTKKSFQ